MKFFLKKSLIYIFLLHIMVSTLHASFTIISVEDITVVIPNSDSDRFLKAINQARSKVQDCGQYGLMGPSDPLVWNDKLYRAAQLHSNDMAKSDTFSHDGSGTDTDIVAQTLHPGIGSTPSERIEFQGYDWSAYGENIAAGYDTLDKVIDAWLESPGHCANMMNPKFTEVGMSLIVDEESTYTYYWTQDFATPK